MSHLFFLKLKSNVTSNNDSLLQNIAAIDEAVQSRGLNKITLEQLKNGFILPPTASFIVYGYSTPIETRNTLEGIILEGFNVNVISDAINEISYKLEREFIGHQNWMGALTTEQLLEFV